MPDISMSAGEIALFAAAVAASGVVSGLLAGIFGIGGGAVLVPVFYQVFGTFGVDESVRMHVSVGSSLAIIIPTSIRSFTGHLARGAVDTALLRSFLLPVPVGVVLASLAAAAISSAELRITFSVITVLVGLKLLLNRESWRLGRDIPGQPWRSVIGVAIGFFSTLMGIGGGVMNNTFMTLYGRPMHQAVATSSGVGVMIAIPGTLGYIWAGWGHPLLPVLDRLRQLDRGALVIPIALIVTPYGVHIAHWMKKRHLEIGFGLFCLFVSARFFVSLID